MVRVVSSEEIPTDVNGIVLHLKLLAISEQLLLFRYIAEKIVYRHATVRCLLFRYTLINLRSL